MNGRRSRIPDTDETENSEVSGIKTIDEADDKSERRAAASDCIHEEVNKRKWEKKKRREKNRKSTSEEALAVYSDADEKAALDDRAESSWWTRVA